MHHLVQSLLFQPLVHLVTQGNHAGRKLGVFVRVHPVGGHATEHHVLCANGAGQLIPPVVDVLAGAQIGEPGVQPIRLGAVQTIARPLCLDRGAVGFHGVPEDGFRARPQRHQQIVPDGALKQIGVRIGIADPRRKHGLMQLCQIMPRHRDPPAARHGLAHQKLCQSVAFGLVGHLKRDARAFGYFEVQIIQDRIPVRCAQRHMFQHNWAAQMRDFIGLAFEQARVDLAPRGETFNDHIPPQRHVLRLVVIGQQFLPRARQILVGGQGRDQRAHRDLPLDRKIPPHGIEKERCQLGDEVVEKLHEEFLLVDLEADLEQLAQPVGEQRQTVTPAAVGAQIGDTGGGLADFRRQVPHFLDPLFVQQVDLPLQHRDEIRLQRDQCDARQPEPRGLQEEEQQDDQHLPRLEHRLGNRIAHQPAHRLCLRGDHRHQLALTGVFEIAARKTHHPRDQLIAEATQ